MPAVVVPVVEPVVVLVVEPVVALPEPADDAHFLT